MTSNKILLICLAFIALTAYRIQAGDPGQQNARILLLGSGDVVTPFPLSSIRNSSTRKEYWRQHARGDDVNPEKASSGCQFYIVTGRKFTEPQLLGMENKINEQREEALFDSLARQHMKETRCARQETMPGYWNYRTPWKPKPVSWRTKKRNSASPRTDQSIQHHRRRSHLDGSYTVFGEVTEGMEVVDNIEIVKTNRADRPIENIRILKGKVFSNLRLR